MVPALLLILATATGPRETPRCADPVTTTATAPVCGQERPGPAPDVIVPDPDPPPAQVDVGDAATVRRIPDTGIDGDELVVAGILILLGGVLVAARPGRT